MNDIDTSVTHITHGNIFEDLGFEEAENLKIKSQLMCFLSEWFKEKQLKQEEVKMETLTYSSLYNQLEQVLTKVTEEHQPVMVTREQGKSAVIMSLEDFQAYEETAYLMASPKNAARLDQAVADIEAGKTIQHGLIEE